MSAPPTITASELAFGSDEVIARLFSRERRRLLAVAARIVSADEAEDVLQDAFVNTLRKRHQFRGQAQPSTWLYRVTVNAALMRLRSKRRRPTSRMDEAEAHELADPNGEGTAPDQLLERGEMTRALSSAIDTIAPIDRQILTLRLVSGASTEATAQAVGMSVAATKTRLCRARAALRRALEGAVLVPSAC